MIPITELIKYLEIKVNEPELLIRFKALNDNLSCLEYCRLDSVPDELKNLEHSSNLAKTCLDLSKVLLDLHKHLKYLEHAHNNSDKQEGELMDFSALETLSIEDK